MENKKEIVIGRRLSLSAKALKISPIFEGS